MLGLKHGQLDLQGLLNRHEVTLPREAETGLLALQERGVLERTGEQLKLTDTGML